MDKGWYTIEEDARTYRYATGTIRIEGAKAVGVDEAWDHVYLTPNVGVMVPHAELMGLTREYDKWMPSERYVGEFGNVSGVGSLFPGWSPPTGAPNAE